MINSKNYVVLDVETNGLSSLKDDLLSISIYKPDDKKVYDRFLPLELNKRVETTWINGITKEILKNKKPLTQEDFDQIIVDFELDKRIILTYGSIDEKFVKNYLIRKKINGYDRLNFYNFKHDIISSKFSEGNITKDNLCNIYGIGNTNNVHSGLNDCILEWELFVKMNGNKLIIINNVVNEFNTEYMIPASYLQTYPNLKYCFNNFPKINYELVPIKTIKIKSSKLKKFDTNISGITIEHLIDTILKCENKNEETMLFQIENRAKLKKIGTLPSSVYGIPVIFKEDGTVMAVNKEDKKQVEMVNKVTMIIKEEITPLTDYIKAEIFNNKPIMSQELVINEYDNVIAKCDLSSENSILEIKTNCSKIDDLKYQLYYEANNRDIYILQTFWSLEVNQEMSFTIYKVNPIECLSSSNALEIRIENFKNKINNNDITILEYNGYRNGVKLKCEICNKIWNSSNNEILRYKKCPFCCPKPIKEKKKDDIKLFLSEKEKLQQRMTNYQNKVLSKSNSTILISNYTGVKEKVNAKCLKCGYEWTNRADHLLDRCYCSICKNKNTKLL